MTATRIEIDDDADRDIFDDPDLLDFEDPQRRQVLAARYRSGRVPGTVSAARTIMFMQPLLPIAVPLLLLLSRAPSSEGTENATPTTTAAVAAGEQAQQRGGGGGFLIAFLGTIVFLGAILVVASRLRRLTAATRNLAVALEAVIVLFAAATGFANFNPVLLAVGASGALVIYLLFTPSTRRAIASVGKTETTTRFDITNLPELER